MDFKAHWELIHQTDRFAQLGWLQEEPTMSIDLILRATKDSRAGIIDIGGGGSSLVGALIREGFSNVTVLDASDRALARNGHGVDADAPNVKWIDADVLTAAFPGAAYDVWHDRTVFHFLTAAADRARYVAQMCLALRSGGHAVIATYAEDGPEQCSGLRVARYSPDALSRELGESFELVESAREQHVSASGSRRSFVYCMFRVI